MISSSGFVLVFPKKFFQMIDTMLHRYISRYAVIVLFLTITTLAVGQQLTVSGTISDESGSIIPGATILEKGTDNGAISLSDGTYKITLTGESKVLIFRSVGLKALEVEIGNQSQVDVTMEFDLLALEEVVVVGYGTQEKADITGSVVVLDDAEIKQRPNTQFGALIQGKAPGVQVLSSSGEPSAGINLRIRGTNSINAGSEPLYIVDGVPTTDTRSINPADIANISILKDASAAAIYGSQGANGVVIINTKLGGEGGNTIQFDTYVGFSEVWRTLDVLDARDYRILMTEMGQSTDWNRLTDNTDWQDEIFNRGLSQNYQLSTTGRNDKTSYYLAAGWVQQEGAVRSSRMSRTNFKVNLDHQASSWLKIGTRMAYTDYSDVDVTDNTNVNSGGVLLGVLSTPPNIGVFNEDGSYTSNPFQNWENPFASTDGTERLFTNRRLIGNVFVEMNILDGLTFKSNYGIDHNNGVFDSFLDPFLTTFGRALNGRAVSFVDKNSYYIFDNTLSYEKTIDDHQFKALAGVVVQKWRWENYGITTQNFSGNTVQTPNGGAEIISATGSKSEKANQSAISRINYEYKSRYLLTANFRADGSSVFGPDNRWGFFPSFSAGWRVSEEAFLASSELVSELKLRLGWGIVGNDQIGNNYAYLGLVGSGANYPIGGVIQPGTFPASINNNTLRWEESTQLDIGVDMGFWGNRLGMSLDIYQKRANDLLLNAPLPRSTGFDNAIQNIGVLENRGVELGVNSVNLTGDLRWTTNLNITVNRNEVIDLVGQEIFVGGIAGRGEAGLVREGLPLGTLFGYIYGGVDPETGNAFYINQEGESTFTPDPEDRVVIGDANPNFFYGITNELNYKGISMTLFIQGSQGGDILNATRIETEGMTDPKNQTAGVLDRWQQPGDITNVPRASWGNTDNSRISTRFIEDASYLRIKTLSLGYDLPGGFLSKFRIRAARVYATGENLLTFTNYTGFDSEVNAFGSSNTVQGIDFGTYPQTRNLLFGLNIQF